ncbi:hypothetical protein ZIOFF_053763 [Zingiber officinale]|uniref:RING-type domain-containing protein n=1 Tax=Zingiber officinale TaxID=94328 RepID=A0A8J5FEZ4_ZINOF|nr:hypothetical protein ZIOFF_053763 [Zingiber officinale]
MEMDLTPTMVNAGGFLLRVQARMMIHHRPTTAPPQLTARFRRRTTTDQDASAGGFTVSLPISLVDHRRTLEREAQAMFTRLLGDDVGVGVGRPELRIMVVSFCAYTVMASSILRVGGAMRISSEVVIADAPLAVLADLPEISGGLARPETSWAVEALEMVLAEQAAGPCAICLEDFEVAARLLVMPCRRHRFHEACLREWLHRSHRCPLCRFSL